MTTMIEIAWIAGLLEGEGCFHVINKGKNLAITLSMCDLDIVVRASRIMKVDSIQKKNMRKYNIKNSDQYSFRVSTFKAVQWMMTIYPLMGVRRKAKIREILNIWKSTKRNGHQIYRIPQRVAV